MCVTVCNAYVLHARVSTDVAVADQAWDWLQCTLEETVCAQLAREGWAQPELLAGPVTERLVDRLRQGGLRYLSWYVIRQEAGHAARRDARLQTYCSTSRSEDPATTLEEREAPAGGSIIDWPPWYRHFFDLLTLSRRTWVYIRLFAPRHPSVRRHMESRRWETGSQGMWGALASLCLLEGAGQNLITPHRENLRLLVDDMRSLLPCLEHLSGDQLPKLIRECDLFAEHDTAQAGSSWVERLLAGAFSGHTVTSELYPRIFDSLRRLNRFLDSHQTTLALLGSAMAEFRTERNPEALPGPCTPRPSALIEWLGGIPADHPERGRQPDEVIENIRSWSSQAQNEHEPAADQPPPPICPYPGILDTVDPGLPVQLLDMMIDGVHVYHLFPAFLEIAPASGDYPSIEDVLPSRLESWRGAFQRVRANTSPLPCAHHQFLAVVNNCSPARVDEALDLLSTWRAAPGARWPETAHPGELCLRAAYFAELLHLLGSSMCSFYHQSPPGHGLC